MITNLQKGTSVLVIICVVILMGGSLIAGYYFLSQDKDKTRPSMFPSITQNINRRENGKQIKLEKHIKSAHFVESAPKHGETFAATPYNIVIDFNFDLGAGTEIKVLKDKLDYGEGETLIDDNKLAARRRLKQNLSDGVYLIFYNACWPDGSCHEGQFNFIIDSTKKSDYQDLTDQKEVTISMKDIAFKPEKLIIKKGTKVTWVNDEDVIHYVNTDSHPGHTFYLPQNSKAIDIKESYSVTFDTQGEYPYHCSAHASNMTGRILVK